MYSRLNLELMKISHIIDERQSGKHQEFYLQIWFQELSTMLFLYQWILKLDGGGVDPKICFISNLKENCYILESCAKSVETE